jgi:transposase InsO family protein
MERTHDGCAFRTLNVIDEYTRECLAIRVERNLDHEDVLECLAELFCTRGVTTHLRSDNGPEIIAIQENGYIESFNGKLRDELLNREIFFTLEEAKTLIARWREEYNHVRPYSSLGYRPPAPQSWLLAAQPALSTGLT